jgi:hypothetical protein
LTRWLTFRNEQVMESMPSSNRSLRFGAGEFMERVLPAVLGASLGVLPKDVSIGLRVEGEGAWQIRGTAEGLLIEPHDGNAKDCEVSCNADNFPAVVRGGIGATRAWVDGRVVITGDVGLLLRLQEAIPAPLRLG